MATLSQDKNLSTTDGPELLSLKLNGIPVAYDPNYEQLTFDWYGKTLTIPGLSKMPESLGS